MHVLMARWTPIWKCTLPAAHSFPEADLDRGPVSVPFNNYPLFFTSRCYNYSFPGRMQYIFQPAGHQVEINFPASSEQRTGRWNGP